jgi:hypothetical protein
VNAPVAGRAVSSQIGGAISRQCIRPLVARQAERWYLAAMTAALIRRIGTSLLCLALALGPVMHAGAAMQSGMEMTAPADAAMPMPEGCDLCGDDGGTMSAAACSANCATPAAILAIAMLPSIDMAATAIALAEPATAERFRPPDPGPPKPIAMS